MGLNIKGVTIEAFTFLTWIKPSGILLTPGQSVRMASTGLSMAMRKVW